MSLMKKSTALRALVVSVLAAATAHAAATREIPSAFAIAKSSNKNQVHYAVRVNDTCAPASAVPIRPYWRMLERGPNATEPLLDREQRAYGIQSQTVRGNDVRLVLRALPDRPIVIRTTRAANGACVATASVTIAKAPARLHDIYIKESLFGVDWLLLTGWSAQGAVVREKITL